MLFLYFDEHFILLYGYFITTGLQFIATFRTELHSPVQAKTDANLIAIKMQSIQVKVVTPPLTWAKERILAGKLLGGAVKTVRATLRSV